MSEMQIRVDDRGAVLRDRLKERLVEAGRLRCPVHGHAVVSVTIHGRENGWFDAIWITCCSNLEEQAAAIVKERC